ncbi:MAG TPA: VTT domain-containing protein [Anaerolineae bacterium]|nr:VTT domain-containing protein [Anaerolineae bacterium]HOR00035.1 VTT domain-containing protein [Anaerolineae bacterium]HPL27419.1 VTT domain-containing protein [Anaerolineae bacterium]
MGFDLVQIIRTGGYLGLFAIVFAESGLFFGFFLPGDSLLLTAGLLASRHDTLDIRVLLLILPVAAILGDNVGYWFGKKAGPALFTRDNSLLFRRKNLLAARTFYERHGGKTIMLARFMPFIRTFAPIVAGAAEMHYQRFIAFNVLGGLIWAVGVTAAGYFLGTRIEKYFLPIVLAVIVVSALPALIHAWKEYRGEAIQFVRTRWQAWRRRSDDADA